MVCVAPDSSYAATHAPDDDSGGPGSGRAALTEAATWCARCSYARTVWREREAALRQVDGPVGALRPPIRAVHARTGSAAHGGKRTRATEQRRTGSRRRGVQVARKSRWKFTHAPTRAQLRLCVCCSCASCEERSFKRVARSHAPAAHAAPPQAAHAYWPRHPPPLELGSRRRRAVAAVASRRMRLSKSVHFLARPK